MGHCLPYGLEGRGHWLKMLVKDEEKVNQNGNNLLCQFEFALKEYAFRERQNVA
jgi:hypothetical protein